LTVTSGNVQVHSQTWIQIAQTPYPLENGDTVRTAAHGLATLVFEDGSRVELAGNTSFTLEEAQPASYMMGLSIGRLKAFVAHVASRSFKVRTPTAVCAVRGTEFQVEVLGDGSTNVDLYKGLLAVSDNHGSELLLHPHESTRVDTKGIEAQKKILRSALQRERFRSAMRQEMTRDMGRQQFQAGAVRELRLADYQQGKSVINVLGQVVRVEEYIVRPSPDQFKLVVLNSSKSGFDYFSYLGTFNTTLPTNLSVALSQLTGTVGAPPTYYLTSFQTTQSNTIDSVVEIANGGHPVNVNNNGVDAPITSYFNAQLNAYVAIPNGTAFYKTLFDNDGFYVDGQLKSGWTGNNIQTYTTGSGALGLGPTSATNTDPITGATLSAPIPSWSTISTTYPNPSQLHQSILETYSDNTFIQWDGYITNNLGQVATSAQFSASSGASFTQQLLNFNYEQVITASEFGGRTIDLVVAPKILLQSGLIQ
jgi:hypothetical protein